MYNKNNNSRRQNKERGYNSSSSSQSGGSREPSVYSNVGYLSSYVTSTTLTPTASAANSSSSFSSTMDSEVSSILECPVCFCIPRKEVYNCENGHSVCETCRPRLTQCALCSARFRGSRNFVVESLIYHFKKVGMTANGPSTAGTKWANCDHKSEGCQKLILNSEVDAHVNECEFRPLQCMVDNECCTKCPQKTTLKLSEYFSHLINQHNIIGLSEPSGIFTKVDRLFMGLEINTNWSPFYLQYDGKVFLRSASIRNRVISWWIQLIGPDSESRKYNATISLINPKNPAVKIAWTVPVFSLRLERKAIEQNNIAAISTSRILPFCSLKERFEDRVVTHRWDCHITLSRSN